MGALARTERDPTVRVAIVASAVLGAWSATGVRIDQPIAATALLGWVRFGEVGLLLAALAGASIGARLRTFGLERAWWTAGADRLQILARGASGAALAGVLVLGAWLAADLAALELRAGLPLFDHRTAAVRWFALLGRWSGCIVLVAILGLLVGQVAGDAARAALLLVATTLPFASEARALLPAPPPWLSLASPPLAVRAALRAGTETAVDATVDHRLGILGGAATLAWFAILVALVLHRDLARAVAGGAHRAALPERRRWRPTDPDRTGHAHRGRRPGPAAVGAVAGLGAAVAIGWVGPHALAPDVPWSLRPAWRTQVAHHRASTQRADAWLRCVAARRRCPELEAPGLRVPAPTRRVIEEARAIEVAPARFQTAPEVVDAVLDLADRRSGPALVVGAGLRLRLRPDGRGGWVVAALSPVGAIVR